MISSVLTFFLKDQLQRYIDYRKLRSKLDKIAGVGLPVIYKDDQYKINNIDRQGVLLINDLQTIFIPINKALDNILFFLMIAMKNFKKRRNKNSMKKRRKILWI